MLPRWSPTSDELFYFNGDNLESVVIRTTPTLAAEQARIVFPYPLRPRDGDGSLTYDVAPDGRFLMVTEDDSVRPDHLVVVKNWGEEADAALAARARRP